MLDQLIENTVREILPTFQVTAGQEGVILEVGEN
jgi:hypothetical protein